MTTPAQTLDTPARRALLVVRRRRWALIACAVLGMLVAIAVAARVPTTYTAQAVVVAPPVGPGEAPPGSPDAANKLASSYAGLIPLDDAVVASAAGLAGMDPGDLRDGLTADNQTGTGLITLEVTASDPVTAVKGATAVANVVTSADPPGQIARNSLTLVSLPNGADALGQSIAESAILGLVLGLLVGGVIALALERADRRIDSVDDLATALGAPACQWGSLTESEAQALAHRWRELASVDPPTVAVLAAGPLTQADVAALLEGSSAAAPTEDDGDSGAGSMSSRTTSRDLVETDAGAGGVRLVPAGVPGDGTGAELTAQTSDLVVIAVQAGSRASAVHRAVDSLRAYGVSVTWGLLADRPEPEPEDEPVVTLAERLGTEG